MDVQQPLAPLQSAAVGHHATTGSYHEIEQTLAGIWSGDIDVNAGEYPQTLPEVEEMIQNAPGADGGLQRRPAAPVLVTQYIPGANERADALPLHFHVIDIRFIPLPARIFTDSMLDGITNGSEGAVAVQGQEDGSVAMNGAYGVDNRYPLSRCHDIGQLRDGDYECQMCSEELVHSEGDILVCPNGHAAHATCWLRWERSSNSRDVVLKCGKCRSEVRIPAKFRERAALELVQQG